VWIEAERAWTDSEWVREAAGVPRAYLMRAARYVLHGSRGCRANSQLDGETSINEDV
jgi:hypothetical protein